MKSVRLLVVLGIGVASLAFLIFTYDPGPPRPNAGPADMSSAADSDLPGELTVGEPLVLGNLTVFPVSSRRRARTTASSRSMKG